jgi:hypothetical protein
VSAQRIIVGYLMEILAVALLIAGYFGLPTLKLEGDIFRL